jgi:hypothetical protein
MLCISINYTCLFLCLPSFPHRSQLLTTMTKQSNLNKAQVTFRSPVFAFLFRSLPNDGVINSTDGQGKLVLLVAVPIEPLQQRLISISVACPHLSFPFPANDDELHRWLRQSSSSCCIPYVVQVVDISRYVFLGCVRSDDFFSGIICCSPTENRVKRIENIKV